MKPKKDRDIEKGCIGKREEGVGEVEFQLWWELS
jgi:hypothetical protein